MSDYGDYGDYGQYVDDGQGYYNYDDQDPDQIQEDHETNVQLAFFEAEELLRKGANSQCLASLEQIYFTAETHNLKNWKVKILNLLLQIYCKADEAGKIKDTLCKISDLNQKEKYSENAIKSIIMTVKSLPSNSYQQNKDMVFQFINQLDSLGKIRSYLLFLEKAVEEKNNQDAEDLFKQIQTLMTVTSEIPPATVIEFFSLEIRFSQETGRNIAKKLRKIQLKLASLEAQAYISEGHLSVIKEALAEEMFKESNYKECAVYLCEAFQQYVKYGKSTDHKKKILKINVLVSLLTNEVEVFTNEKYNCLFHESATFFKADNDVQSLYGLIECFKGKDIKKYTECLERTANEQELKNYEGLKNRTVMQLRKNKIIEIIRPYSTVKLSYLSRRLQNLEAQQVYKLVFELICDEKIRGRLRKSDSIETYLDLTFHQDELLTLQRKNIRLLQKRYI